MGLADRRELRELTVALSLDSTTGPAELDASITALGLAAEAAMRAQGVRTPLRREAAVLLRLEGTDSLIEVPHGPLAAMKAAFEAAYRERFGFVGTAPLIAETIRVEAIAPGETDALLDLPLPATSGPTAHAFFRFPAARFAARIRRKP